MVNNPLLKVRGIVTQWQAITEKVKSYINIYTHTHTHTHIYISVHVSGQFSLVTQSCSTLCDPKDCSMPVFPALYHIPELAQTHVHQVCEAIQPPPPLVPPYPSAFNLPLIQGLFQ